MAYASYLPQEHIQHHAQVPHVDEVQMQEEPQSHQATEVVAESPEKTAASALSHVDHIMQPLSPVSSVVVPPPQMTLQVSMMKMMSFSE